MTTLAIRTIKKATAALIKFAMAAGMLAGLIGIPYLIITTAWDLLARLFHQYPLWFVLSLIPIAYLAIKLWKWLYEILGATMMAVGSVVDKLERESK